jgi:hypothetical protein
MSRHEASGCDDLARLSCFWPHSAPVGSPVQAMRVQKNLWRKLIRKSSKPYERRRSSCGMRGTHSPRLWGTGIMAPARPQRPHSARRRSAAATRRAASPGTYGPGACHTIPRFPVMVAPPSHDLPKDDPGDLPGPKRLLAASTGQNTAAPFPAPGCGLSAASACPAGCRPVVWGV